MAYERSPDLRPPTTPPASEPPLRPPGGTRAAPVRAGAGVWLGLAATGLLALVVVSLPGRAPEAPGPRSETPPPADPALTGDPSRAAAQAALEVLLREQARLSSWRAERWGEPEWGQARAAAQAGDRDLRARRYTAAAAAYRRALGLLRGLASGREARLASALAEGARALAAGDAAGAAERFERALVIEPGHAQATRGLAAARARPAVLRGLRAGRAAETEGRLEEARRAYAQAVALDGDYAPAAEAARRVAAMLAERQFRAQIGAVLAALESRDWKTARVALGKAERLRPRDPAVGEVRARLARATQAARVAKLGRRARARARAEDWGAAAERYRQALTVAPDSAAARAGLARARSRLRLHAQLDHYLEDPARLSSEEPLANAERLLAATEAPAGEPRLAAKLERLARAVRQAREPVAVTLRSDALTEVVVYHVGRLGRLRERRLELRPGRYTALGSRAGYRDVRIGFTVAPGRPPPAVVVRCEERL